MLPQTSLNWTLVKESQMAAAMAAQESAPLAPQLLSGVSYMFYMGMRGAMAAKQVLAQRMNRVSVRSSVRPKIYLKCGPTGPVAAIQVLIAIPVSCAPSIPQCASCQANPLLGMTTHCALPGH